MKLIDLFKIRKKKKSQNRISKTNPMQQTPQTGDGYMSSTDADVSLAKNDGNSDQI